MKFVLNLGLGAGEHYRELARAAEDAGWDGLNLPDSIFFPRQTESDYPYNDSEAARNALAQTAFIEPFVAMAQMTAVTTRLHVYPAVLKLPVRQPLLVAKSLTSLATLSDNRVSLGAGLSPWKEDFAYNGLPFESRGAMMDECIEIVRGLMSGDYFEFHGRHYDFGPIKMTPVPREPVPILIGGHSKPALRRAARTGDGWVSANSDLESLEQMVAQLQHYRREYGTDGRDDFQLHLLAMDATTPDDFRRLEALGATHACVAPWNPYDPTIPLQEKLDKLRATADDIISAFH